MPCGCCCKCTWWLKSLPGSTPNVGAMPSLLPLPSCFNLGTPASQSQCWKRWFYNMAIDGDDGDVPKIWGTFWHILTRRRIAVKKTSQCPGLSSLLRWSKWKPGQQMRKKLKTPWQLFSRSPRARRDKKTMTTGSDYQWLDSKLFLNDVLCVFIPSWQFLWWGWSCSLIPGDGLPWTC